MRGSFITYLWYKQQGTIRVTGSLLHHQKQCSAEDQIRMRKMPEMIALLLHRRVETVVKIAI